MQRCLIAGLLLLLSADSYAQTLTSPTLSSVRARGTVICGVEDDRDGFSKANSLGEYSGFSIDLCRAVSAALFVDPEKTALVSHANDNDAFADLRNRKIDVLLRNTPWTLSHDASVGEFSGIHYFDGQGFMVWKHSQVRNPLELDNISLCLTDDSNAEINATHYFSVNNLRFAPVPFATASEASEAYGKGLCDAITTNQSTLAVLRSKQTDPNAHRILSAVVSKTPSGPIVRANDAGWANVVRWSLYCMINAEELGVTQNQVNEIKETDSIHLQRLVGLVGGYGGTLGLKDRWCADIIRSVGNYGESYERHVGENTAINLPRGFNNLWINGGLIFAPAIR